MGGKSKTKQPKKIVLTGGPGVGKTSILESLRKMKHDVRHEVFTQVFAKAQEEGRFNDEFLHSQQLVHALVQAQANLEALPTTHDIVILDRSKIDILIFAKMMGITPYNDDRDELEEMDYNLCFVIEPLPERYYDQNSIRRQTFQESLWHHENCTKGYSDILTQIGQDPNGCLIHVPFYDLDVEASILKRNEFILAKIQRRIGK